MIGLALASTAVCLMESEGGGRFVYIAGRRHRAPADRPTWTESTAAVDPSFFAIFEGFL